MAWSLSSWVVGIWTIIWGMPFRLLKPPWNHRNQIKVLSVHPFFHPFILQSIHLSNGMRKSPINTAISLYFSHQSTLPTKTFSKSRPRSLLACSIWPRWSLFTETWQRETVWSGMTLWWRLGTLGCRATFTPQIITRYSYNTKLQWMTIKQVLVLFKIN